MRIPNWIGKILHKHRLLGCIEVIDDLEIQDLTINSKRDKLGMNYIILASHYEILWRYPKHEQSK